jgi:hypothetical protein
VPFTRRHVVRSLSLSLFLCQPGILYLLSSHSCLDSPPFVFTGSLSFSYSSCCVFVLPVHTVFTRKVYCLLPLVCPYANNSFICRPVSVPLETLCDIALVAHLVHPSKVVARTCPMYIILLYLTYDISLGISPLSTCSNTSLAGISEATAAPIFLSCEHCGLFISRSNYNVLSFFKSI